MQQIKRTQHTETHLGSTAPFSLSMHIHDLVCACVHATVCGAEDSLASCLLHHTGLSKRTLLVRLVASVFICGTILPGSLGLVSPSLLLQ